MSPTTVFVIAVTTARMIFPGMPDIPGMGNVNATTRTLTMDLTDPKQPTAAFKAECAIPAGLKLGPKVDLVIDLPKPSDAEEPSGAEEGDSSSKMEDFTFKLYWGCSQTVPPGQPKVMTSKDMTAAMKQGMERKDFKLAWKRAMSEDAQTHAYWPGPDAKPIARDAACPGDYVLTTNFCGGTSIKFDAPQDFLAPIDLTSPGNGIDFKKAIRVEWKPVSNAEAYLLMAFSGSEKEMVMWTSSLDPNKPDDIQGRALSRTQLETYLKNGVLLPPDKTFCYIPEGIFKNTGQAMLSVTAIGADKVQVKDGIETDVIVRSNAMVMLGEGMGFDVPKESDSEEDAEPSVVLEGSNVPPPPPGMDADQSDDVDPLDSAEEALDEADEAESTADKAKNLLNRAKSIFKR